MLAIMPLILSLAPEIARWIGGNQAAGVTTAVADAVRSIAGTDNPEDAAKALAADPAKAAELRVQLAKIAADAETAQRASELESLKVTLSANAAQQQADPDFLRKLRNLLFLEISGRKDPERCAVAHAEEPVQP